MRAVTRTSGFGGAEETGWEQSRSRASARPYSGLTPLVRALVFGCIDINFERRGSTGRRSGRHAAGPHRT